MGLNGEASLLTSTNAWFIFFSIPHRYASITEGIGESDEESNVCNQNTQRF